MASRSNAVWRGLTLLNAVYEAIYKLSRAGDVPVRETDLITELESTGLRPSRAEVVKALITLEILGYARVKSSGWDERIILFTSRS